MKKFTVPCNFNGQTAPFTIYIGEPEQNHHPLHFQSDWLGKMRGGQIPQEIMESLGKIKDLAVKNDVSFEDLCVYALGSATDEANDVVDEKMLAVVKGTEFERELPGLKTDKPSDKIDNDDSENSEEKI